MITYESHRWRSLLRLHGSVLPKGAALALIPTIFAGFLKICDENGWMGYNQDALLHDSAGFSVFGWTLSFVLVFRTGHCYARFWACATGTCTMRAQLFEACSSLVSFSQMSRKPVSDVHMFRHQIVRLTSLIHALALSVVTEKENEAFAIIDLESIPLKFLEMLRDKDGRAKVELAYIWINNVIVRAVDSGVLNVPPPILSRVFQELEKAMVEYNQVMQIMTIPFPFPFAQFTVVGICVYFVIAPFAMVKYASGVFGVALFTFMSCSCLLCLELISTELDNPFGDDANDLPCHTFQEDINEGLTLLLDPASNATFYLEDIREFPALKHRSTWHSFTQVKIDVGDMGIERHDESGHKLSGEAFEKYVSTFRREKSRELGERKLSDGHILQPDGTSQTIEHRDVLEKSSPDIKVVSSSPLDSGAPNMSPLDSGGANINVVSTSPLDSGGAKGAEQAIAVTPSKPKVANSLSSSFEKQLMDFLSQIHGRLESMEQLSQISSIVCATSRDLSKIESQITKVLELPTLATLQATSSVESNSTAHFPNRLCCVPDRSRVHVIERLV